MVTKLAHDRGQQGRSFFPEHESFFLEVKRVAKEKIMDLKSILIPVLFLTGWLVLYGIILPTLGINT